MIDLANLTAEEGFAIQGGAGDGAGFTVSSAGDVNGDGIDDIIIGAPYGDDGGDNAGEAYVIFGSLGGFGTIDLSALTAAQGFVIQGDQASDSAGWSVSGAGDVNGDGIDDLFVGAPFGSLGGPNAGQAYVIFGSRAGFGTIDLSSLSAAQGFIIHGDAAFDNAGWNVSAAGDLNGDGIGDVIVGAPFGDDGNADAGEAYVIFGSLGGFGTIDLSALTAAQGFVIQGIGEDDQTGFSVSAAGDVNGDGIDDLIVGARYGGYGGANAGAAYVIFGSPEGFGTIDLAAPPAGVGGFGILGDAGDLAGFSVSAAGDVNGDGIDDLIVGAPVGDSGGSSAGRAYVIFGARGELGDIELSSLSADLGFIIQGASAGDVAGWSVSSAGDVNGDGIDDLIVGAPYGSDGGTDAGEAYVIFGSRAGFGTIDLSNLTAAQGFVIQGDPANAHAGFSVSAAGDVDGDGIDDLIVGAPGRYGSGDASGAYVIFGQAQEIDAPFPLVLDLTGLSANDGFIIQGASAGDNAGWSVSDGGDVNGDGIDDVIVGAPYGDDAGTDYGEAYVIYGSVTGFGTIDLANLTAAQGFIIRGDAAQDQAGRSVSAAGDVNGDGIDDLIVGAPLGDDAGANAGEAYVIFGSPGGVGPVDLSTFTAAQGFIIQGDSPGDFTGISVSAAGDVNGDGIGDLVVGAPLGDDGGSSAGEAYVIFGSRAGFGTIDLSTLTAAQGFIIQGDTAGDNAGWSVSGAGDVNGDGIDDLIVGARGGDDGGSGAGEAYVIFGSLNGFGTIDLSTLTAAQGFIIQGDNPVDQAGWSVSRAGDVNGDGIDDLIVGANYGDDGGANAGEAYVIFGSRSALGTIDLSALTAAQGFIIQGDSALDQAGFSVSAAGDVNGDGIDDLIVGAPLGDNGGTDAGEAYVIYGRRVSAIAIAQDDALTTDEATAASGDLFADNGSGADDDLGGTAVVTEVNGVAGNVGIEITLASGALLTVDEDGTFDYDPNGAFDDLAAPGSGASNTTGTDGFTYTLTGGDEATVTITITGLDSYDVLAGTPGDDNLDGGLFIDRMAGGAGDDIYHVDMTGDRVMEDALGGYDTVIATASHRLDRHVEALTLAGSGAINATGNASDNLLAGNAAANVLNGKMGADTMRGGNGNDTYLVDDAGDVVEETSADAGYDTVKSSVEFTLGDHVERLILFGGSAVDGTGNDLANVITGNGQANRIDGGAGADRMTGMGGDDVYVIDDVGDVVRETKAAHGTDTVESSVSYTLGRHLEALILTGSDPIDGTGNAAANTIIGNAAANRLHGSGGDDAIHGGLGNDVLIGGPGADAFHFDTALGADNLDQVLDFTAGEDKVVLDAGLFAALAPGALQEEAFAIGTAAADGDDRIVYDPDTGTLRYDPDGSGAAAAIAFATLADMPQLAAGDFAVI